MKWDVDGFWRAPGMAVTVTLGLMAGSPEAIVDSVFDIPLVGT
jgi:hypothetical protein